MEMTKEKAQAKSKTAAGFKLKEINANANVVIPKPVTAVGELELMEQSRIEWENKELAASNRRLYGILKRAYKFYIDWKTDDDKNVREARKAEIEKFIAVRKYEFGSTTHDMTRVVKCVFGMDRRRVSAYSIALREALRQHISEDDLIAFIENEGGVEQIRLNTTPAESPTIRAEKVKQEVFNNQLCDIKINPKLIDVDADWNDKPVVIIATYRPTGMFEANAIVKHDGAVTAALAAYDAVKKAKVREAERELKKANEDAEKFANAGMKKIKAQPSKKLTPAEKLEKQKKKVSTEVKQQKREQAFDEHFNKMFEAA